MLLVVVVVAVVVVVVAGGDGVVLCLVGSCMVCVVGGVWCPPLPHIVVGGTGRALLDADQC